MLTLDFQGLFFSKCCISGMGGPIDMEQKGCESNFENSVSQEWEGRLTWNERDVS